DPREQVADHVQRRPPRTAGDDCSEGVRHRDAPTAGAGSSSVAPAAAAAVAVVSITLTGSVPSTRTARRLAPLKPGNHQFRSPSSSMLAGTSTMRTIVASTSTAAARPKPTSCTTRRSAVRKLPNTATMIAAAAVMTLAVDDRPSTTAVVLSPVLSYC